MMFQSFVSQFHGFVSITFMRVDADTHFWWTSCRQQIAWLQVCLYSKVLSEVKLKFKPKAVVCQCGVDTLAGDPMASFNLTQHGIGECVKRLMDWNLPLLLLGGGGYNIKNAARCWTYLTSIVLNQSLSSDIPEHENFLAYGPDYQLDVPPSRRQDMNSKEDLINLFNTLLGNIKKIVWHVN